jgi:hypothetical protein
VRAELRERRMNVFEAELERKRVERVSVDRFETDSGEQSLVVSSSSSSSSAYVCVEDILVES